MLHCQVWTLFRTFWTSSTLYVGLFFGARMRHHCYLSELYSRTNGFLFLRFLRLQLPIQTHHLSTSGVGRVVYFYTKVDDSRVTPSIKRKAHALVGECKDHTSNFCYFYNSARLGAETSFSQGTFYLRL